MAFEVNVQGHPNGNYEEYRHLWNDCENNDLNCDALPTSWSWLTQHVDAHFFFLPAANVSAINWEGFPVNPPPPEIQAKCDDIPPAELHPTAYYNEGDCVPRMGRHWVQDKLETKELFERQPALIYGSYAGESVFWEVMVATPILNWVRDFAPYQRSVISYPQPYLYQEEGMYPTHYTLKEVTDPEELIGGGKTSQIGMVNFVYRDNVWDPKSAGVKINAWFGLVVFTITSFFLLF